MELKRDIYQDLIKWKKRDSGKVLELKGARQAGKTFILDKFAKENYQRYFYINMMQTSGSEYLACLDKSQRWEPGDDRAERPLHDSFALFDSKFVDDKDTIIVIDEIQESARVYSLIRQFAREFECHFVVTGSYLGKTIEPQYFLPAGDTEDMALYTLSFAEFLQAMGKRYLYDEIDLYGGSEHEQYDELKELYEVYCQIGGYPAVVMKYLETKSQAECEEEIAQIIRIFVEESIRYFGSIVEMNLFNLLFPAIAQISVREKKGHDNLIKELSNIIYREDSNQVTRKSVNAVISWLYRSNIIGYCGKSIECNPLDTRPNVRFYFMDVGVSRYFLKMGGVKSDTLSGYISENFVYLDLLKRTRKREVAGFDPMFGTYKDGEIDFFVSNTSNDKDYGVEVKAGKSKGKTAAALLNDGKVEAVYFLKGNTYGGIEGRMLTIPIYLASRVNYDFIRVKK